VDISLIIAAFVIFGLPIIIIGGAALFPPKLDTDPYSSPNNWGSQDVDAKLNIPPKP
jgi:hypothetical protein